MTIRGGLSRTDIEVAKMEADEMRRTIGPLPQSGEKKHAGTRVRTSGRGSPTVNHRNLRDPVEIGDRMNSGLHTHSHAADAGSKRTTVAYNHSRIERQLSKVAVPKSNREAIMGDLRESASGYSTKNAKALFYVDQFIRSFLPFVWLRLVDSRLVAPLIKLVRQMFRRTA